MIEDFKRECRFGIDKCCWKQPCPQQLYVSLRSIWTGAPPDRTLENTCRRNNDCFTDVRCQQMKFGRLKIIVQCCIIILPIIVVVIADRKNIGVASGGPEMIRRTLMSVRTDIQFESQFIQIISLEESLIEFLNAMEWAQEVCRKTTFSAVEIVSKAVFASICAWSGCAHSAQSIGGWSFKTNDFEHQRLSYL